MAGVKFAELNAIVNSFPEGSEKWVTEMAIIAALDKFGSEIGYGALEQLAQFLLEIQCHDDPKNAIDLKRSRFASLGWKLPDGFPKERP